MQEFMWFWRIIYWAVVILYVGAIALAALVVSLCAAVIVRRLVLMLGGKSIDRKRKRADRAQAKATRGSE